MAELDPTVWVDRKLSICSLVGGRVGCFHLGAVVTSAVRTCVYMDLFESLFSTPWGLYLGVEPGVTE